MPPRVGDDRTEHGRVGLGLASGTVGGLPRTTSRLYPSAVDGGPRQDRRSGTSAPRMFTATFDTVFGTAGVEGGENPPPAPPPRPPPGRGGGPRRPSPPQPLVGVFRAPAAKKNSVRPLRRGG